MMNLPQFFSTPNNVQLTLLILASPLDDVEKEALLTIAPLISDSERSQLIENLQQEIAETDALEEQAHALIEAKVTA